MSKQLTRRESVLTLASGLALLAGCSSSRQHRATGNYPNGTVGDPLPGSGSYSSSGVGQTRGQRALEQWDRVNGGATGEPGVVRRPQWASTGPVMALAIPMTAIRRITVHHDGMRPFTSTSSAEASSRLESIRRAHVSMGWADIGYHYAIDPSGRVYECRPLQIQGAHVKHHNEQNLGVVLLGNFDEQVPTRAALASLEAFLVARMRFYRLGPDTLFTHQELRPTACPGRSLQRFMVDGRRRGATFDRV